MSASKPPPPKGPVPPRQGEGTKPGREKKSGRVAFDSRGNASWEWEMKTGVFGRDIDTKRLKKLEARDLKIAEDQPLSQDGRQDGKPHAVTKQARAGGFDPYNSSNTAKSRALDQLIGGHKPYKPFKKKP